MMKETNFAEFRQVSLLFDEFSGLKDCDGKYRGNGDYLAQLLKFFAVECSKGDNSRAIQSFWWEHELENDFSMVN